MAYDFLAGIQVAAVDHHELISLHVAVSDHDGVPGLAAVTDREKFDFAVHRRLDSEAYFGLSCPAMGRSRARNLATRVRAAPAVMPAISW